MCSNQNNGNTGEADVELMEKQNIQGDSVNDSTALPQPTIGQREFLKCEVIQIAEIQVDKDLYPRAEVDDENVERLVMLEGKYRTRLVISEDCVLVDGQHRLKALEKNGIKEAEVEVYQYGSDDALLQHAVELNCQHGKNLSQDEKKGWVRKNWTLGSDTKALAKVVGVAPRTVENWTNDLRADAKAKRDREIAEDLRVGKTVAQAAAEHGVSESTVKRAGQERKPAEKNRVGETTEHHDSEPDGTGHNRGDEEGAQTLESKNSGEDKERTEATISNLYLGHSSISAALKHYLTPDRNPIPRELVNEQLQKITAVMDKWKVAIEQDEEKEE